MEIALNVEVEFREIASLAEGNTRSGTMHFGVNTSSIRIGPTGNQDNGPRPNNHGSSANGSRVFPAQSSNASNTQSHSTGASTGNRPRGHRQLPYNEFLRRKEEGKCYYGGLDYSPNHQCQAKSLQLTILAEEEGDGGDDLRYSQRRKAMEEMTQQPTDALRWRWKLETDSSGGELSSMELSLASKNGVNSLKTMKLVGKLNGESVVILVDSGASHNFIALKLIQKLELLVTPTVPFGIKLGDGGTRRTSGCCKGINLQIGDFELKANFFAFELGGVDIILGVTWLRTLGNAEVNWEEHKMAFVLGTRFIELRGDPILSRHHLSPRAMAKVTEVESAALVWIINLRTQ